MSNYHAIVSCPEGLLGMVHSLLCLPSPAWALQGRVFVGTDPNHGLDGQVIRCVRNGLDWQNQRPVSRVSVPSGQPEMDGICRGVDYLHQLHRQ